MGEIDAREGLKAGRLIGSTLSFLVSTSPRMNENEIEKATIEQQMFECQFICARQQFRGVCKSAFCHTY